MLALSLLLWQAGLAQSITLREFYADERDLSARTYERLDLNGERCALIKVQLPLEGCVFEGAKVGDVEYKVNEYWLYVPAGTKRIKVKCPGLESGTIVWEPRIGSKYGTVGGFTYVMLLDGYRAGASSAQRDGNYMIFTLTPPDATVRIDGQQQAPPKDGRLSVFLHKGAHSYEVSAFGYATEGGSFSMGVERQSLSVSLASTMSRLTLDCATEGVTFYVNDERKASGSWTGQLPPGSYRIEARKEGCGTRAREIVLEANASQTVHFPALEAVTGVLNVGFDPIDAEVWLDGRKLGLSPGLWDVSAGSHTLEVKSEGYIAEKRTVTVSQGRETLVQGSLGKVSASSGKSLAQLVKDADAAYGRMDYSTAVSLYRQAAEQGDAHAQSYLGSCYHNGLGVTQDTSEGVKWLRKSAGQGNADGQCWLGWCYQNGLGVSQDFSEAVNWYRKSAEQGNATAQYGLSCCYQYGLGVAQDSSEAVKWVRKSAEQGNKEAQCGLGLCYQNGWAVAQDSSEAVNWFRKSAEQGCAAAQYCLSANYYGGAGVTQDISESVKWCRKSAEQGYAAAQFALGYFYESGEGVTKDVSEALNWYRKAAANGIEKAKEKVDELTR